MIGQIIDFALKQRCVRGVTFQPTQVAGRLEHFNPLTDRLTPTAIRSAILEQTNVFAPNDLLPVPCNPDALTMAYALKIDGEVHPLTRYIDPALLLNNSRNTIVYEQDEGLHEQVLKVFSTANSVDAIESDLHALLCCLPAVKAPGLGYQNLFRVIIMNFMDAYDFDVRSVKKSCVHIVAPNGHIIPFETVHMFYRSAVQRANLASIRAQIPSYAQSPSL